MSTSKKYSVNTRQWVKGLYMAVISAVITYVLTGLQSGGFFPIAWDQLAITGVIAGLTYIKVTFLSDEDGKVIAKKKV